MRIFLHLQNRITQYDIKNLQIYFYCRIGYNIKKVQNKLQRVLNCILIICHINQLKRRTAIWKIQITGLQ